MSVKRFDISGEHYEVFGDNNGEYCLYEDYAALEARCAALAAENAGLKKFCKDAAFDADYESELLGERGGFVDGLSLVKTQATDAFLAEVQASGIDQWIASRNGRWNGTTAEAERFATQLRKGVQS